MPNAWKYAYSRLFPVAPAFTETGVLALEGQRRVLECMIDERVDGICILAHCSEQFLLSEQECDILVDLSWLMWVVARRS